MIHEFRLAPEEFDPPQIETPAGVYEPALDSRMLMEAVARRGPAPGSDVLDVCAGTGIQAIAAARLGHRAVAVDTERAAVIATRRNALINDVEIDVIEGDLFEPFTGWRFDAVLANPPYVPTPRGGEHASWCDGGPDGRTVINRICREAPGVLREGGKLWMVHSSLASIDATLTLLEWTGFTPKIVSRETLRLGPVSRARISHLRQHGHLAPGATHEELVVIEARWTP